MLGLIATLCGIIGALIGFATPVIKNALSNRDWRRQQDLNDENLTQSVELLNEKIQTIELLLRDHGQFFNNDKNYILTLYQHNLRQDCLMYLKRYEAAKEAGFEPTISTEEFTNLETLFDTYKALGGNGVIEGLYNAVCDKLTISNSSFNKISIEHEQFNKNFNSNYRASYSEG